MTRLGITQRVEDVADYGERRDCLDQEWTVLLEELGFEPVILPNRINDVTTYLDGMGVEGVVMTSGNDLASLPDASNPSPERDRFERAVLEYAIDEDLPVLGVCRGLELINAQFGGALVEVDPVRHVAVDHQISFTDAAQLSLPKRATVNSYHDYGIRPEDVADNLAILALADDGTVEGLVHDDYPIWGIMWHPERESPRAELDRRIFNGLFGGG